MTQYARVLVGIDGTDTSARAAARAIELAAGCGAELHLVDVVPLPALNVPVGPAAAEAITRRVADDDRRASAALASTQQRAQAHGVATVVHLEHGDPAQAIVAAADQMAADVIVVGNRGVDGAGHYVVGNVPEKVLLSAPCDVLVVHTTSS